MKDFSILALVGCALLAGACQPKLAKPRFNAARAVDAIKTGEVHWNADWKSGDADRVAAHYAPGAVVVEGGGPPAVGPEAIRAGVQKAMDDKNFSVTFVSDKVDVAASGDLAVSHGTYALTVTDPATNAPVKSTGSFATVYKPQPDGAWKAVWDIAAPTMTPVLQAPGQ